MGSGKFAKEMNALKEHLGKHQLKFTRRQEMILTAFLRQEHITAEAMYHQLAKTDPHLGLATIYRTLNLFCDAGIAQARHLAPRHSMTTCRIRVITTTSSAQVVARSSNSKIAKSKSFRKKSPRATASRSKPHRLELYGLCSRCRH